MLGERMTLRALTSLVASILVGCPSPSPPTATSTSSVTTAGDASSGAGARTPAGADDLAGSEAPLLRMLGGKYLCEQRIYLPPGGEVVHLSAWEWSFEIAPDALAARIAATVAGAEREGNTFRWKKADGSIATVVDVRALDEPPPSCAPLPAGTQGRVVVSRR